MLNRSLPSQNVRTCRPSFKGALTFCAAVIASPAFAQSTYELCNGLGGVQIVADGDGFVVSVLNPYCAPSASWPDRLEVGSVELDGVRVVFQFESQDGTTPDTLTVFPPLGYYADPASVEVDESQVGSVRVTPMGLS